MNKKSRATGAGKRLTVDSDGLFSKYPTRLENTPAEYQAAVYAKKHQEKLRSATAGVKTQIDAQKRLITDLKEKINRTADEVEINQLFREIRKQEKKLDRLKAKRKKPWSPVFPGSFESGKRK